jgi:hypothetical protein
MKSGIFKVIILFLFFITSTNVSVAQNRSSRVNTGKNSKKDVIRLFNGKDLGGWVFILKDPSVDPLKVFTVRDGLIHISGAPFGYMRTKKSFSEYKLHAEWRWPAEATNSGIFIHAQLPDTLWPRCFECQLAAGNAGDFVCANGSDMNEHIDKTKKSVKKMNLSNEKAVGEWNTMEVICKANTIEVFVNGALQNKASGTSASEGFICLQSEGKDIEFRNLILTKLY